MKRECKNPKCNNEFIKRGNQKYCNKVCLNKHYYIKNKQKVIDDSNK